MAWTIELTPEAVRDLDKLDKQHARRVLKFIHQRLSKLQDPRSSGSPLKGPELGKYWRYRIGDHRVICKILDDRLMVLVLQVGHRREVYR
jgi:mRNA interferase RelE/StbE